jgi:protoporphyrinogen oxidase
MEVNIIGAGLNGCLSAWKIKKKFPNYIVNLIDSSDHVISAFDPIEIGKGFYNNGFHGIELPRSKKLSHFFESCLNINLLEKKNIKKLLIVKFQLSP